MTSSDVEDILMDPFASKEHGGNDRARASR
jgi:hypothetical protein